MSILEGQLTADRFLAGRSAAGIHVWHENDFSTLWIATRSMSCQSDGAERFVTIGITLREPENAIGRPSSRNQRGAPTALGDLSLHVSTSLLDMHRTCAHADLHATRVIADPVAFEMTLGIVQTHSSPHIDNYTKSCMVSMLCTHVSERASTCPTPSRCRVVGLAHWQRIKLETAFSELGKHEVSLELFASHCGLSICHFARLFKVTYGMPFHQYVVQRKISHACSLLSESQESISQIALECGFSDQSSFTRRFSATTGISPSTWRKQFLTQRLNPAHASGLPQAC
ncbi:Helix-turn-helix domain-containing protein [Granulicella pectinivorans]|uniref:Helix-turn-helix domain-containing protein n=2 Tax=Granulicella pectinivorans TaxID=474950 RepID=A0A1I6LXJ8_9BACT|nr:Helix-turn-helix domain-containing protein [Granulicella pectinivorans]